MVDLHLMNMEENTSYIHVDQQHVTADPIRLCGPTVKKGWTKVICMHAYQISK